MLHIISTNNLQNQFSSIILSRGRHYLKNGHIIDIEKNGDNQWEAEVAGTEIYNVEAAMDEEGIGHCFCSCPFAVTSPCKHIAAVLLYIQLEQEDRLSKKGMNKPKSAPKKRSSKRKTLSEQVDEHLELLEREQLVAFIKEVTENSREVRNLFLSRFATDEKACSKSEYRRLIKTLLAPAKRRGLVYGREADSILKPVNELLQKAAELESSRPEVAMAIAQAAIEELIPAFQLLLTPTEQLEMLYAGHLIC